MTGGRRRVCSRCWWPVLALLGCAPSRAAVPASRTICRAATGCPPKPPRAVILAVHGFNDYSNAFDDVRHLRRRAGHRRPRLRPARASAPIPTPACWPGIQTLVDDLVREREQLRGALPGRPVYLLGESMGAAVLIAAVADERAARAATASS